MSYPTPPMTGYLHLPPLWVVDDLHEKDRVTIHATPDVDLSSADDIICGQALNDEISIWITRDGFVTFIYAEDAAIGGTRTSGEMVTDRLSVANAHLACLHSAIAEVDGNVAEGDAITHLTIVHGRDTGIGAHSSVTRALLKQVPSRTLNPWGAGSDPYVEAIWVPVREYISPAAVKESVVRLTALMSGGIEQVRRYELLLQAGVAMREHNFALAVITAAALAEHAALALWNRSIREIAVAAGGTVANDAFESVNAYPLLRLLRATGSVPDALYLELEKTRKARNSWVHKLVTPTSDDANSAQKAAAWTMALADRLDFVVWPTLPLKGWMF